MTFERKGTKRRKVMKKKGKKKWLMKLKRKG